MAYTVHWHILQCSRLSTVRGNWTRVVLFCCILGCLGLLILICIEFVYLYFPVLFCLSVSVKWLAVKCKDRLRNDLYCVEWGVKLYSNQPNFECSRLYGTTGILLVASYRSRMECISDCGPTDGTVTVEDDGVASQNSTSDCLPLLRRRRPWRLHRKASAKRRSGVCLPVSHSVPSFSANFCMGNAANVRFGLLSDGRRCTCWV